jgi:hypothetical protein
MAKRKKDVILEYIDSGPLRGGSAGAPTWGPSCIDELQRAKYNISLENLRFINNRKVHFFME